VDAKYKYGKFHFALDRKVSELAKGHGAYGNQAKSYYWNSKTSIPIEHSIPSLVFYFSI
jgi:hypothetical protein